MYLALCPVTTRNPRLPRSRKINTCSILELNKIKIYVTGGKYLAKHCGLKPSETAVPDADKKRCSFFGVFH